MKKTMKIRLLSILLCFVMLVGLLPATAFAVEQEMIRSISATVTLPTAGAHPVETGTPGDGSYTVTKVSFSEKDAESGLLTSLEPSDTFEAGKTYRINVMFRPNSGFTIDIDASATVNGMDAEYWSSISDGWGSKYFGLEYTVPEEITNFTVLVPAPVAGGTADTRGIRFSPTEISAKSAEWCALKDGVGLVSVNKFSAGTTYYLRIEYDVAEGYTVSNNATVSHNLTGGKAVHNSSNKTVMIEYTVAAQAPTTYTVSFDANGGDGTMTDVTGVSGEYTLPECSFVAPEGKQFKAWSVDGEEKAAGDKITVAANITVVALWEDVSVVKAPITSVTVSGVTEPVIGEKPDFDITLIGDGVALYEYDEEEWEAIGWEKYNPETGSFDPIDKNTAFEAGLYFLYVDLQPEEGYAFTDTTKFYYNDDELPEFDDIDGGPASNYELWDGCAGIYLYFTLEEEPADATVTLEIKTGDNVYDYAEPQGAVPLLLEIKNLLIPDDEIAGYRNTEGKLLFTVDTETWVITVADGVTAQDAITCEFTEAECIELGLDFTKIVLTFITEIKSLSATVTEPVAGASPSFEAVAEGEGYTAELEWEIVAEETIIYPEDDYKFKAGEEYGLWVLFIPEEGYEFADDMAITINGKTPEILYEYEGNMVGFVTHTVPATTPIDSVKISDVTEPVIGATPDFDITLTGEGVAFNEEEGTYAWYKVDPEARDWELLDEDTSFGAGLYVLGVFLKSEAGYEFSDATKFYYNDDELPEYEGSYESNYECWGEGKYADIYLYFTLEESDASFARGDVNNNGKIDATDALLILQHSVKLIALEGDAFEAADVNRDEKIDAADALRVLQYAVKLIESFD